MTGKEKMLASMTGGLTRDFPVVIPYIGIFLRDHWDEITDEPWWSIQIDDIESRIKIHEDLQDKVDLDWVSCGLCHSRRWRRTHKVEVLDDRVFLLNTINGSRKEVFRPQIGGAHIEVKKFEQPLKSNEDIDKYIKVEKANDLLKIGKLDYAKAVVERFGPDKFVFASIGTPNEHLSDYFGIVGMVLNIHKNPQLVDYFTNRVLERNLEIVKSYARIGVDGIFVEECLPLDMISPTNVRRFALPSTKILLSEIRRLGMKSVIYCCGNMRLYLDGIIEAEPDAISLEESKKGFDLDIEWINERISGKCCIFGNLDAVWVLGDGSHADLEREIRRQLNIGRKHKKFVMSLGSPVTPLTTTNRVKEYVDITREISSKF
jgi:uroporphyrinogen-III decarboxylase